MAQRPGYPTIVKVGGAPIATTNEPTTKVTANTVFQITDASKRVLDPAVAITVEVDATGGGSWATATGCTVDPYTGTVTFAADQGSSALVRVSGSYVPLLTVGTARATSITAERTAIQTTAYNQTGWKSFIAGMLSLAADLELVEDGRTDHDPGAGTRRFLDLVVNGTPTFLEIQPGGVGKKLRAWTVLSKGDSTLPMDDASTFKVTARAAGRGTAPSASFAA